MNKLSKHLLASVFSLMTFSNEIFAKENPSFDCAKATTEVEKLICSDDELAKLDVELNYWYNSAIEMQRAANIGYVAQKSSQNEWIKRRNKLECNPKITDKKKCLVSLYKEALQVWKNFMLRAKIQHLCKDRRENGGLVYKCDFEGADKLIAEGADLNGYDDFYECWHYGPVYCAALSSGKKDTFDYVVRKGADFKIPFRATCGERKQALDCLGGWKFFDEIMKLNPNTDLNKWKYWRNLLPNSIRGKVKLSTDKYINYSKESQKYIEKLIDYGANVNITNENGDNIPYIIFNYPSTVKDFPFDYELTLSMLKYLIANGLDISHKNKNGHNALYYLQNSRFKIDENYYMKYEKLLTPQNKGEKHD